MKQTLTIEQMQHLKELGLELKESLLYWARCVDNNPRAATHYGKWVLIKGNNAQTVGLMQWEFIPAYTLADIIEMLPKQIEDRDGYQSYIVIYHDGKMWVVSYSSEGEEYSEMGYQYHYETGIELIDAAYKMLCWCLENKYIETKEK